MAKRKTNGGWQYGRWHMKMKVSNRDYFSFSGRYKNPMLNRSRLWKYARSYQEARDKSPFPERPVR